MLRDQWNNVIDLCPSFTDCLCDRLYMIAIDLRHQHCIHLHGNSGIRYLFDSFQLILYQNLCCFDALISSAVIYDKFVQTCFDLRVNGIYRNRQ